MLTSKASLFPFLSKIKKKSKTIIFERIEKKCEQFGKPVKSAGGKDPVNITL